MKLPALKPWLIGPLPLIAVLAGLIVAPRPDDLKPASRGTAYTDTVNRLFEAGHLEGTRRSANAVRISAACRSDEACQTAVRDFAVQSYLKDDMKQTGGDTWIFRGGRITGLQAFTRLYYDNDVDLAVIPPRIVYASAGVGADDNDRVQVVDLDRGRSCDVGAGESRSVVAGGLCSAAPASGCDLTLKTTVAGGVQAYVAALTPAQCGRLYADGKAVTHATIASGTVLRIDTGPAGTRPARLLVAGASGTMAATDSQGVRYYDHGFGELARYLERSAPDLAPQLKSGNEIRLSLRRRLNLQANTLLAGQMRPQVAAASRNILAAAVLMDGVTGEVAAVPTFPFVSDDLLDAIPGYDPRLDRNANFMNLSIGSAAKVPFATAIAARWPELREMKVADNEATVGRVLGYPADFDSHSHGAPVDFSRFIAESSNRYAIALMAAGLRTGSPLTCERNCKALQGEQGIWLGGRRITTVAPAMMKNPTVAGEWRGYLQDYFDIPPGHCLTAPDYGTATLWGSRRLGSAYELNPPSLCLTQVKTVTPDYYMSILGGSRSLWSTLFLAQTYGRIVSNQRIETTLLARDGFRDGYHRVPFPPLGMDDGLHQTLRAGMQGTLTQPAGTARRMMAEATLCNQASEDGLYLYTCFAKTGTGRIRAGEDVHSLALVIEKTRVDQTLCSRSVVAINIQHRKADATPAITYAISLLKDPLVRTWLDRPCS
ncbi:hypothetical protein ABI_02960 [Asticcacaulis biprosthecium C19]|uniref:Penicillin binding protein transpeptidase domain protein n=1 Tax=Asticcacaulis biprosthecium C19 TaxID=715226 RepID=F4QJ33_9CAUL|nr:hypothetical protein [Asticcacaulis biprosthecium]EGF91864.1 hypothetical protein ABI_02960 [Asticcacaulis biprosthecium C19]